MSEIELYDYTRGYWVLSAKYGIAVYEGIIQEVYEIVNWYKAGTTYNVRQKNENIKRNSLEGLETRYEFIGNLAPNSVLPTKDLHIPGSFETFYK